MRSFIDVEHRFGSQPARLGVVLARLDVGRGREALYRDQLPELLHALATTTRVASITASSAIEGVVVAPGRLDGLVKPGADRRFRNRNEREFAGYRDAIDEIVRQRAAEPGGPLQAGTGPGLRPVSRTGHLPGPRSSRSAPRHQRPHDPPGAPRSAARRAHRAARRRQRPGYRLGTDRPDQGVMRRAAGGCPVGVRGVRGRDALMSGTARSPGRRGTVPSGVLPGWPSVDGGEHPPQEARDPETDCQIPTGRHRRAASVRDQVWRRH